MTKNSPPSPLHASDFEAIEEALLNSARGRWFLSEYARQNRTADTQMLLDALTKLEAAVMRPGKTDNNQDRIRSGLIEMSESIAQTRQEIAAITSSNDDSRLVTATEELDAIVEATEKATSAILEAAEDIQETAWVLREKGTEDETCDRLDQRATDIYTACSFQDITGQRTGKVVDILRYLETRVNSMIDIWGLEDVEVRRVQPEESRADAHLLNGPQLDGQGLQQNDIDDMISVKVSDIYITEDGPAEIYTDVAPAAAEAPQPVPEQAASSTSTENPPQITSDEQQTAAAELMPAPDASPAAPVVASPTPPTKAPAAAVASPPPPPEVPGNPPQITSDEQQAAAAELMPAPDASPAAPVVASPTPPTKAPAAAVASPPPPEVPVPAATPEASTASLAAETNTAVPEPAIPDDGEASKTVAQTQETQAAPAEPAPISAAGTGVVSAEDFTSPQELTLNSLDAAKTGALFS